MQWAITTACARASSAAATLPWFTTQRMGAFYLMMYAAVWFFEKLCLETFSIRIELVEPDSTTRKLFVVPSSNWLTQKSRYLWYYKTYEARFRDNKWDRRNKLQEFFAVHQQYRTNAALMKWSKKKVSLAGFFGFWRYAKPDEKHFVTAEITSNDLWERSVASPVLKELKKSRGWQFVGLNITTCTTFMAIHGVRRFKWSAQRNDWFFMREEIKQSKERIWKGPLHII